MPSFSKEKQTGRKEKPNLIRLTSDNGKHFMKVEKRKPINPISKKQLKELAKRDKLRKELLEECGGLCQKCGQPPDKKDGWGKLHLVHIKSLAQGGQTNRKNCYMGCRKCHMELEHHLKESE